MNKTRFFILLIYIGFSVSTFSQRKPYVSEKYIGLTAGMTGSMVYFKPTVDQSFQRAHEFGLVYRYIGTKHLGLETGINYNVRGWRESNDIFERELTYLDVPFLSHFNFGRNFRFFFNLGPRFSYLLSQNVVLNNGSGLAQQITAVPNKLEYGLQFSTGFYLKMKRQLIQIEAKANYSAVDLYPNQPIDDFDYSNSIYASVNFSWMFQLK